MKLPPLVTFRGRRQGLLVIAGLVLLVLVIVLASVAVRRRGGGEALRAEPEIAAVEATCLEPQRAALEELEKNAPPTALDGADFVRGLEQLPFLAAVLSQRDTSYEEANTKDPAALAHEGRAAALRFADLAIEVATCYERELAGNHALRVAAGDLLAELRARRAELETLDFAPFYAGGEPAEAVLTLAPKEEKHVRLRTLCIDRMAQPPLSGMPYVLAGTVDVLMKPELCDLLRGASASASLADAQNAVWRLEQRRATPGTPAVVPVGGATGAHAAQLERRLAVTATATGTLTALDVTFTNLTDQPLTIDTSCAVFVPLIVPDTSRPLPTPPPDWSDPATLENFQQEADEQLLKNLDEIERVYRQQGLPLPPALEEQRQQLRAKRSNTPEPSPAGSVLGVYRQAFLPGSDVDPDDLDPFQPVQTGVGPQPLGTVGVTRRPPQRRERLPRPWDIVRRERGIEARELLERALDRHARAPADPEVFEDLMRELRRCEVTLCMPPDELRRVWEQVTGRVQRLVDVTLGRVQDSTTAETFHDVVNALRLCAAVGPGCAGDAASRELDRFFRDYLRQQQQRQRAGE